MNLALFDLHCDTAYEAYIRNKRLRTKELAVDFNIGSFSRLSQVLALWSDKRLSNEDAYQQCLSMITFVKQEQLQHPKDFLNCTLYLAVEDARILYGQIERLDVLYQLGVRFLTLCWAGNSCIGGAYDTNIGLTAFGKQVIKRCFELGIIPDLSHASIQTVNDVLEIANGRPLIASHSNAFAIHPHPRNLPDELFREIVNCNGLVGINLYTEHLGLNSNRSATDMIMKHIDHFLALGGEQTVCFGCDFDGAETPSYYQHPSDLFALAKEMEKRNFSYSLIEKIFYKNAEDFLNKNISL